MLNGLFPILEEQSLLGFTGKINILLRGNKKNIGEIVLSNGEVIHATFQNKNGFKSLVALFLEDLSVASDQKLQYVVEPEIVDGTERTLHFPFAVLRKKIEETISNTKASEALKPPMDIKLLINENFIYTGEEVTVNEFKLLKLLTVYNEVGVLYKNSDLLDYELTEALVSLRKKGALRVVK